MNEAVVQEFVAQRDEIVAFGDRTRARLEQILRDARLAVHSVTSRVKETRSLALKLARPDKNYASVWDVTDLLGLRVETYFEDHVELAARLVESNFRVDFRHSADRGQPTGYRSVHYVCHAEGTRPGFRFEVQLRTVLQHAWAEVEHDLGYKADDAVPEAIRRRFTRVASLLEIADQEFVSIRRELATSRERARATLDRKEGDLPIDLVSIDVLTRQPAVAALDGRLAVVLKRQVDAESPFFPDYLVRVLRLSGLETTSDVSRAIERHASGFEELATSYAGAAKSVLQFDAAGLTAVQRGYSLLMVAHAAIARGPELGLSKVARLTRLYQALEFPNDERAAHDVATALIQALG